ncbi:MAG: hypothetical protein ACTSVY_01410 [Candidatus Helarchaeota archaeon]
MLGYWLGVIFAITSGIANNLGTVLQKKAINDLPVGAKEEKFIRNLIKNPIWVLGLILQMVIGTLLFMVAQIYIGPTLIPGLMAAGLIFLAIGSVKLVGEELKSSEIIGIILMLGAITLIGFSNMSIDVSQQNFLDFGLLFRIILFTLITLGLMGLCKLSEKKKIYPAISMAIISGFMFALSNFWISPLMGVVIHVFNLTGNVLELIIFIISAVILTLVNVYGITTIQEAMKQAQASNMIPIQQVPIQIYPIFYFLLVYLLPIPSIFSLFFMISGIGLVIVSSFLLGRRQVEIEKIQ